MSAQYWNADSLIGGDILSLVTSGMYVSPLAVYREYLQNAADAIASSSEPEDGKVEITLNRKQYSITIRDNGPGLSYEEAIRELVPISRSQKQRKHDRGFRGIGRLSGLAFGRSVTFLTRSKTDSSVIRVVWNGERLRNGIDSRLSVEDTILQCVSIERDNNYDYPTNFFEVRVEGISHYAASTILNRDIVRNYVEEVCPVPIAQNFPYGQNVSNLFKVGDSPFIFNVYLDGEKEPVTRLNKEGLNISEDRSDRFTGFEEIKIPALGDSGHAAIGWIAHSSYLGSIPKKLGLRSIRARVGNIQIGTETVFDHLFSETRFNRWCVAEIHIQDSRIIPNARRDYFEPNTHLRNLENHLNVICRKLERQCRQASEERNRHRYIKSFLAGLDASYELAAAGYLSVNAAKDLIDRRLIDIAKLRKKNLFKNGGDEDIHKLDYMEEKFLMFKIYNEQATLPGVAPSDQATFRNVFRAITEISPSPQVAKQTIEAILNHKAIC